MNARKGRMDAAIAADALI